MVVVVTPETPDELILIEMDEKNEVEIESQRQRETLTMC